MAFALAVTNKHVGGSGLDLKSASGPLKLYAGTITASTTYTGSGGDTLDITAADGGAFPAASIWMVQVERKKGYSLEWDSSAKKLLAYSSGGTELANGSTALTTIGTFKVVIYVLG